MDYRYTRGHTWKLPIFMICWCLVIWAAVIVPKFNPSDPRSWLAAGLTLSVVLISIALVAWPHVRRMQKKILRLSEDALEFPEGPMAQTLKLKAIELVTERRQNGVLKSILIHVSGGFVVKLSGLTDMEGLIRELREKLPPETIRIL